MALPGPTAAASQSSVSSMRDRRCRDRAMSQSVAHVFEHLAAHQYDYAYLSASSRRHSSDRSAHTLSCLIGRGPQREEDASRAE